MNAAYLDDVYERDMRQCWICDSEVLRADATIDHVVPLERGGADDPNNWRLAHRSCNSRRQHHPGDAP